MLINAMLVKNIEFNSNANCWRCLIALGLLKKTGSLVTMIVALFFAEHRSAINSPITISSGLLSLNSITLDYTKLVA